MPAFEGEIADKAIDAILDSADVEDFGDLEELGLGDISGSRIAKKIDEHYREARTHALILNRLMSLGRNWLGVSDADIAAITEVSATTVLRRDTSEIRSRVARDLKDAGVLRMTEKKPLSIHLSCGASSSPGVGFFGARCEDGRGLVGVIPSRPGSKRMTSSRDSDYFSLIETMRHFDDGETPIRIITTGDTAEKFSDWERGLGDVHIGHQKVLAEKIQKICREAGGRITAERDPKSNRSRLSMRAKDLKLAAMDYRLNDAEYTVWEVDPGTGPSKNAFKKDKVVDSDLTHNRRH